MLTLTDQRVRSAIAGGLGGAAGWLLVEPLVAPRLQYVTSVEDFYPIDALFGALAGICIGAALGIAEGVIVGAAAGAAMLGLRPVAEIMTINFAFLAMDQIVWALPRASSSVPRTRPGEGASSGPARASSAGPSAWL